MDTLSAEDHIKHMEHDMDVLVAGGGLVGGTLALALARAGFTVGLVDPASGGAADRFDGRSYALALTSCRLLAGLGLWEMLAETAQPIRHITVTDGRPGQPPSPFALDFDQGEIEEGPMGQMVEDRHLRPALHAALTDAPGVTLLNGSVTEQRSGPSGIRATLADGRHFEARLLAGCDGRASGVARRAGIRRTGWGYGQTALVCAIAHERPHDGVAHQLFLPEGPLAILPLTGNRVSIVWTQPDARASAVEARDDTGYLSALRERLGGFLGEVSLAGDRYKYPLALSLAERLAAPRVALAGDAAHVVHPIAGQGLNAGLKDVAAMAETLVEAHRRGEDPGRIDVLERYQRWRRFDIMSLAASTDAFNRLFSNDNPIARLGRDLGMGLVNVVPAVRRAAIREAAGLTGDVPRLLRGLPL